MGKGNLQRDENSVPAIGGIDTTDPTQVLPFEIDPATGRLLVTAIITSGGAGGAGTEYTDGDADATPTGTAIMGFDGSSLRAVTTDAQGDLQVDVLSLPTVTVQATNLDIRDLNSATDSVAVTGTVAVSGTVDTELPTAAALTDNMANPTAPAIAGHMMVWDGTTWDRVRASIGDGAPNTGILQALGMMFNGTTLDRLQGTVANGLDVDPTRLPVDTYAATSVDATASGDTNIVVTSAGQTARLYYVSLSANGANSADVTASVKIGANTIFKVSLKAGAIWARNIGAGRRYLAGAAGDDIIITLSAAQTVHVSAEYEII